MDIEAPRELWKKFKEMLLLCYNTPSRRKPMHDQQKLVGTLSAQKILLFAPLLKWYLDHGLKITVVHRTINYVSQKTSTWFRRC